MSKPYQEENSVFSSDGVNYNLNYLFKITQHRAIHQVKVSDIDWVLDFVTNIDESRVEQADTEVPLLITSYNRKLLVVDGLHRLAKAKRNEIIILLYKLITPQEMQRAIIKPEEKPAFTKW